MKRDGVVISTVDSDDEHDDDEKNVVTRPIELKQMHRDVDESGLLIQQLMHHNADKFAENRVVESRIKAVKEAIENYQSSEDAKALKRLNAANRSYEQQIERNEARIKQLETLIVDAHPSGLKVLDDKILRAVSHVCSLRAKARERNTRRLQDIRLQSLGYAITADQLNKQADLSSLSRQPRLSDAASKSASSKLPQQRSVPRLFQHRIADSAAKLLIRASNYQPGSEDDDGPRDCMSGSYHGPGSQIVFAGRSDERLELYAVNFNSSCAEADGLSEGVRETEGLLGSSIRLRDEPGGVASAPPLAFTSLNREQFLDHASRRWSGGSFCGDLPSAELICGLNDASRKTITSAYKEAGCRLQYPTGDTTAGSSRLNESAINFTIPRETEVDGFDDYGISDAIYMVTELLRVLTGKCENVTSVTSVGLDSKKNNENAGNGAHDGGPNNIVNIQKLHTDIEQAIVAIKGLFSQLKKNTFKQTKLNKLLNALLAKRDRIRAKYYQVMNLPDHTEVSPMVDYERQKNVVVPIVEAADSIITVEHAMMLKELQELEDEISSLDTKIADKEKSIQRMNYEEEEDVAVSSNPLTERAASAPVDMVAVNHGHVGEFPERNPKHLFAGADHASTLRQVDVHDGVQLSLMPSSDKAEPEQIKRPSEGDTTYSYPIVAYSAKRNSFLGSVRKVSALPLPVTQLTLPPCMPTLARPTTTPKQMEYLQQLHQLQVDPHSPDDGLPGRNSFSRRFRQPYPFNVDEFVDPVVNKVTVGDGLNIGTADIPAEGTDSLAERKIGCVTDSGVTRNQLKGRMLGSRAFGSDAFVMDLQSRQQLPQSSACQPSEPAQAVVNVMSSSLSRRTHLVQRAAVELRPRRRTKRARRSRIKRRLKTVDGEHNDESDVQADGGSGLNVQSQSSDDLNSSDDDAEEDTENSVVTLEQRQLVVKAEEAKVRLRNTILKSMMVDDDNPSHFRGQRSFKKAVTRIDTAEEDVALTDDLLDSARVFSRSTVLKHVAKRTSVSTDQSENHKIGTGPPLGGHQSLKKTAVPSASPRSSLAVAGPSPPSTSPKQSQKSPNVNTCRKSLKTQPATARTSILEKIAEQEPAGNETPGKDDGVHLASTNSLLSVVVPEVILVPLKPEH
jgi:hypothetical protein